MAMICDFIICDYGNDFPFGLFVSDSSNLLILSNFISLKCLPKICQCLWNLAQMSSSGFIVLHSNCVSHDSNFYPTLVKAIASWVFLSPSQLPTLTILLFLPGVTFSSMTSLFFLISAFHLNAVMMSKSDLREKKEKQLCVYTSCTCNMYVCMIQ